MEGGTLSRTASLQLQGGLQRKQADFVPGP